MGAGELAVIVDPTRVAFFKPDGLSKFKSDLFDRIGAHIKQRGGRVVLGSIDEMAALHSDVVPIVGCTPELRPLINYWLKTDHPFCYWDRGYL